MPLPAKAPSRWREFGAVLREELAPRPGRGASVARIAVCCVMTTVVGMVFQIPQLAVMVYFVFMFSGTESAASLVSAVGGIITATLTVVLTLLLFSFDASEPALRLSLMAAGTFLGMFLMRASALGPVAYLTSLILMLAQTMVDTIPSLETLVRIVLWLWIVIAFPAVLTALVNLIAGENPAKLARDTALRLLDAATAILQSGHSVNLVRSQTEALGLLGLQQHAEMLDRSLRAHAITSHQLIETAIELLTLLQALPAATPHEVRGLLAAASAECRRALASDTVPDPQRYTLPQERVGSLTPEVLPIVAAIADALYRLGEGLTRRRMTVDPPPAPSIKSFFVPDAFSNPAHARFAFKTMVAVMAAYAIYTLLDWPGIHTAVITCFIVAQGSLGETMHKLTLRLTGALIGGAVAAFCIVFLLPHMTDIGQLCLLIGTAAAIFAWVATSSAVFPMRVCRWHWLSSWAFCMVTLRQAVDWHPS
jgi:multidrug resistance protein MdtO